MPHPLAEEFFSAAKPFLDVLATEQKKSWPKVEELMDLEYDLEREKLKRKIREGAGRSPDALVMKSPTPEEQRARILAEVASLDAELTKILGTISDEEVRAQVRAMYDDKKHKKLEQLRKL